MASDLPSWLQAPPPSEPFQALLAGVRAGTGIASNVLQGQQQAEQRRQFDIEAGFKQRAEEYQLQLRALDVEKAKTARDYQFQTDRAATEIGKLLNTTDPLAPEYMQTLGSIAARYPAVMQDPVYQHASQLPLQAAHVKLYQGEAIKALNPLPPNAADAQAVADQVKGLEQQGILEGKPPFTDLQKITLANKLRQDKEFSKQIQGSLSWDDQGRPILSIGGGTAPTVATSSFAQKNINTAEKNYQLLDFLDKNLRSEDLGVRGVFGEAWNKIAPQIGVPGFDPTLATNREVLKVSIQGMVRQISSDTRFSENDRQRAEAAQVSAGPMENLDNASRVLNTLKDIIRNRARVDAQTAGMPAPEFAMTPDEITKGVQSGKIPKEKGIELRLKYYPELYGPTR